jgi:hypothetical protein
VAVEIKDGDNDISGEAGAFEAVAADTPPGDSPEDTKVVTYHGKATQRHVTEEQWRQAGVMDQDYVEWNTGNDFSVPVDQLSEKALEALRKDTNFSVPARG